MNTATLWSASSTSAGLLSESKKDYATLADALADAEEALKRILKG